MWTTTGLRDSLPPLASNFCNWWLGLSPLDVGERSRLTEDDAWSASSFALLSSLQVKQANEHGVRYWISLWGIRLTPFCLILDSRCYICFYYIFVCRFVELQKCPAGYIKHSWSIAVLPVLLYWGSILHSLINQRQHHTFGFVAQAGSGSNHGSHQQYSGGSSSWSQHGLDCPSSLHLSAAMNGHDILPWYFKNYNEARDTDEASLLLMSILFPSHFRHKLRSGITQLLWLFKPISLFQLPSSRLEAKTIGNHFVLISVHPSYLHLTPVIRLFKSVLPASSLCFSSSLLWRSIYSNLYVSHSHQPHQFTPVQSTASRGWGPRTKWQVLQTDWPYMITLGGIVLLMPHDAPWLKLRIIQLSLCRIIVPV